MGSRDTEEMLEACQADSAQLERDLAQARASLDTLAATNRGLLDQLRADAEQADRDLARVCAERDVQIVETKRLQRAVDDVRRLTDRWGHGEGGGVPAWVTETRAIIGEAPDHEHA